MAWLAPDWSELIQNAGIIGSLGLGLGAFVLERQARRAEALFKLTERHGAVWGEMIGNPALARILDAGADPAREPITPHELMHVTKIILHLGTAHGMYRSHVLKEPEGLTVDMCRFFALPIPAEAWARLRDLQDRDFVRFVEEHVKFGA